MLEKILESPLDCKKIKLVNPKGSQSQIFTGRTDAKAKVPILWPPGCEELTMENPDAWKYWRQEEKGTTKNDMAGWHHWPDGHVFKQALGVRDGQRSLACCSRWGRKELDMTEWLKWTELNWTDFHRKWALPLLASWLLFWVLFINFYIFPFWSSYFSQSINNKELIFLLLSTASPPTCKKGLSLGLMSHIRRKVHKLKTYWSHIQLIRIVRKEDS